MMLPKHVGLICEAFAAVLAEDQHAAPQMGNFRTFQPFATNMPINAVFSLYGHLEGPVLVGLSLLAARRLVRSTDELAGVTFDRAGTNAIAQWTQRFAMAAQYRLECNGIVCSVGTISIIKGARTKVATKAESGLLIPYQTNDVGLIEISLGLVRRLGSLAA
jgi:CheY-specific phosphatase CheX